MLIILNSYNLKCSLGSLVSYCLSIAQEHARELNTRTWEYTVCERQVISELYRMLTTYYQPLAAVKCPTLIKHNNCKAISYMVSDEIFRKSAYKNIV